MSRYLIVIAALFTPFFFTLSKESRPEITCAHHQLCNLLFELLAESEHQYVRHVYPDIASDPHELKIDPDLLKQYYKASYLVLVDPILAPWQSAILKERNSDNTFVANVSAHDFTGRYPDARAHFWLYPDELCFLRKSLATRLQEWKYQLKKDATFCSPARTLIITKKIKAGLKKHVYLLTHDALAPLLESMNAHFLVLKASGHTHEISPEVFKELHQLLEQNTSVSWIVETEIGLPAQMKELVRAADRKLKIKVTGHPKESTLSVLENFARILHHE